MKKSAKSAIIISALLLTTTIATATLVGCGKQAENPFDSMSVTNYSTFMDYVSDKALLFNGIKVTKANDEGQLFMHYTLETVLVPGDRLAHLSISANVLTNNEVLMINGEAYLIQNKLYIDNGKEKYFVPYVNSNTYGSLEDATLKEWQLMNKYMYSALNNTADITPPSTFQLLSEIHSKIDHCIFYQKSENENTYFKVECDTDSNYEEYLFHYTNSKIQSYQKTKSVETNTQPNTYSLKFEQLQTSIKLPGNENDWKAKEV